MVGALALEQILEQRKRRLWWVFCTVHHHTARGRNLILVEQARLLPNLGEKEGCFVCANRCVIGVVVLLMLLTFSHQVYCTRVLDLYNSDALNMVLLKPAKTKAAREEESCTANIAYHEAIGGKSNKTLFGIEPDWIFFSPSLSFLWIFFIKYSTHTHTRCQEGESLAGRGPLLLLASSRANGESCRHTHTLAPTET